MKNHSIYQNTNGTPITTCEISPCGNYLAFNCDEVILKIVSLKLIRYKEERNNGVNLNDTLPCLWEKNLSSPIRCLDFGWGNVCKNRLPHRSAQRRTKYCDMSNAYLLAVCLNSGEIKIYSLIPSSLYDGSRPLIENDSTKLVLHDDYTDMTTISFSTDGSLRLASVSIDCKLRLWDMWDDGNMYGSIILPYFIPKCCSWGNRSQHVCVVGSAKKVFVYEAEKPFAQIASLSNDHYNDVSACRYSSDDSFMVTCSFDTSLIIWCAVTYRPLLKIWQMGNRPAQMLMGGEHLFNVRDLILSPDCVHLVSVADDNIIRLWNLEELENPEDKVVVPFQSRRLIMNFVRVLPDGRKYIVGTNDGRLIFFDGATGPEKLISLCRKVIRAQLVYHLHSHRTKNTHNTPIISEAMANPQSNEPENISSRENLTLDVLVDRLFMPKVLKCYLLYELRGTEVIDNFELALVREEKKREKKMSIS